MVVPRKQRSFESVALTMFVFGLLVWVYVVVVQITHPEWLPERFSHLDYPPFNWRVDEVGMMPSQYLHSGSSCGS